jgi:hypothetical protein
VRFSGAEQIEVGAIQDQDGLAHGSLVSKARWRAAQDMV